MTWSTTWLPLAALGATANPAGLVGHRHSGQTVAHITAVSGAFARSIPAALRPAWLVGATPVLIGDTTAAEARIQRTLTGSSGITAAPIAGSPMALPGVGATTAIWVTGSPVTRVLLHEWGHRIDTLWSERTGTLLIARAPWTTLWAYAQAARTAAGAGTYYGWTSSTEFLAELCFNAWWINDPQALTGEVAACRLNIARLLDGPSATWGSSAQHQAAVDAVAAMTLPPSA